MSLRVLLEELAVLTEGTEYSVWIWKAKDGKWYMDVWMPEAMGHTHKDATTYGPYDTEKAIWDDKDFDDLGYNGQVIKNDKSGRRAAPKKSPNGKPVSRPRSGW